MAKTCGIRVEAVPAPSAGLASILSDHQGTPGEKNGRANLVCGVVESCVSHSDIVSSPLESSSLCGAAAALNTCDDLKEEAALGADRSVASNVSGGLPSSKDAAAEIGEPLAIGVRKQTRENAAPVNQVVRPSRQKSSGGGSVRSFTRLDRPPAVSGTFNVGDSYRSVHAREMQESLRDSKGKLLSHLSSPSQVIPRSAGYMDKDASSWYVERQSAPVQVPDWSKITVKTNVKAMVVTNSGKKGDKDDDDNERLPPHELLAKEYARSRATAFSVCEGQGRTLKGRDLSRVRDAVWRQMGFAD